MLCRLVTVKGIIYILGKFKKDPINIPGTSFDTLIVNLGQNHQPHSKMVQICIVKCKFGQHEILIILQFIYHTLEDLLIILYVHSHFLWIQKILLKKWAKHRVFNHFWGWLMTWPKLTIGVYRQVPGIFMASFSNLHIYYPPECNSHSQTLIQIDLSLSKWEPKMWYWLVI